MKLNSVIGIVLGGKWKTESGEMKVESGKRKVESWLADGGTRPKDC